MGPDVPDEIEKLDHIKHKNNSISSIRLTSAIQLFLSVRETVKFIYSFNQFNENMLLIYQSKKEHRQIFQYVNDTNGQRLPCYLNLVIKLKLIKF